MSPQQRHPAKMAPERRILVQSVNTQKQKNALKQTEINKKAVFASIN
jgi:hypothetical protein